MEGVTILSQSDVYVMNVNMVAFWITFAIIFAVIGAFIVYGVYTTGQYAFLLMFFIAAMASVLGGCLFGAMFGGQEYSHTQYKVTIDESVSMTEFYERYEVIDQEGLIFTVKEK